MQQFFAVFFIKMLIHSFSKIDGGLAKTTSKYHRIKVQVKQKFCHETYLQRKYSKDQSGSTDPHCVIGETALYWGTPSMY